MSATAAIVEPTDIDRDVVGAVACTPAQVIEHEGMSKAAAKWLKRAARRDGAIAARVFAAADVDELDETIDELVDSGDVVHALRVRWRAVREVQLSLGRPPLPAEMALGEYEAERMRAVLGAEAAEIVRSTLEVSLDAAHLRREMMLARGTDDAGPDAHTDHEAWEPRWNPESILDLVPPWRTAVVRSLRGLPAAIGVVAALEEGEPLEPWLAVALAERWFDGEHSSLRMLLAWAGVVSDDPLPSQALATPPDPAMVAAIAAAAGSQDDDDP